MNLGNGNYLRKESLGLYATVQPPEPGLGLGTPLYGSPNPILAPSTNAPFSAEKTDAQSREELGPKPGLGFPSLTQSHLHHPPLPRLECHFPSFLLSSAFLGKEKSSPGGRLAGRWEGTLIHQLPAALVTSGLGPRQAGWECQPSQWVPPPSYSARAIQGFAAALS